MQTPFRLIHIPHKASFALCVCACSQRTSLVKRGPRPTYLLLLDIYIEIRRLSSFRYCFQSVACVLLFKTYHHVHAISKVTQQCSFLTTEGFIVVTSIIPHFYYS